MGGLGLRPKVYSPEKVNSFFGGIPTLFAILCGNHHNRSSIASIFEVLLTETITNHNKAKKKKINTIAPKRLEVTLSFLISGPRSTWIVAPACAGSSPNLVYGSGFRVYGSGFRV